MAATRALCAPISEKVAVYAYAVGSAPDALERGRLARLRALGRETVRDELAPLSQGEHDELFDGLQTMVEGAMECAMAQARRYPPFARW